MSLSKERRSIVHFLRVEAEKVPAVAMVIQSLALRIECEEDRLLADLTEEHADTDDLGKGWPQ